METARKYNSGKVRFNLAAIRNIREIRDYTEAIFFGLSLRQFIFSALACGIAVGLYFDAVEQQK